MAMRTGSEARNGLEPLGLSPWPDDCRRPPGDTEVGNPLNCPPSAPEVSRCGGDLRSRGWLGRETGHNPGRKTGRNFGRSLAAAVIRGYQRWISPYKGFRCAHRQLHRGLSCSEFALQAVLERGVLEALPDIRNQFRECGAAARMLREQRRPPLLAASSDEGYELDNDYGEEDESDDRMITDRFYEESERKRKRLQELKSGDPHYSDCPDWCFFSCGTCEFIEPYCCWTPW